MQKGADAVSPGLVLILLGGLFAVVGVGMWLNTLWGLLTGGPRDRTKMGQPYIFDRTYYALFLVLIIGWTAALLSFLTMGSHVDMRAATGFMVGWGVMAAAMGVLLALRRDMMLNGHRYLAKNGFVLTRWFHAMQLRSLERQSNAWKIISPAFIVTGIGVLIFNLPHVGEVPGQVTQGAQALIAEIQKLVAGHA